MRFADGPRSSYAAARVPSVERQQQVIDAPARMTAGRLAARLARRLLPVPSVL